MKNPPRTDYQQVAQQFYAAGLKVIPFKKKGTDYRFPSWKSLLEQPAEVLATHPMWADFAGRTDGLALLMTDDLEAIDIDSKNDPTGKIKEEYWDAIEAFGADEALARCVQVTTKSGGSHYIYRAKNRQRNLKLASRPTTTGGVDTMEVIIETRGEGGLLFIDPSPGYSVRTPWGYTEAPMLTDEERNSIIQAARACDRMPEEKKPEVVAETRSSKRGIPKGEGKTPWEAFNETSDVLDMLESMGWTVTRRNKGVVRVARPRSSGPMTDSGSVFTQSNIFYPFTTSTVFEAERGYTPYAVYAYTAHGGDFTAAAKALYSDGFGDRIGPQSPKKLDGSRESIDAAITEVVGTSEEATGTAADELVALLREVDNDHTFDLDAPDEKIEFVMYWVDPDTGAETGISALGMFGLMVGLQKSGKTTLLTAFVVAALTDGVYLNFRFALNGRSILWLDCEQPRYWFQLVCRRVYRLARLTNNSPRLRAVSLRRYSKAQRAAITGALILREKNLGLGIIDGLVDICQNFNDVEASELTIDKVLEWSDRSKALLLGVIHLTKGQHFIKGHLGTIAQNKCDFAFETAKTDEAAKFRVTHREARGPQIADFDFYRNDKGDPVLPEAHEKIDAGKTADARAEQREKAAYGKVQLTTKMNTDNDVPF